MAMRNKLICCLICALLIPAACLAEPVNTEGYTQAQLEDILSQVEGELEKRAQIDVENMTTEELETLRDELVQALQREDGGVQPFEQAAQGRLGLRMLDLDRTICLGMSPEEVAGILGEPAKKETLGDLEQWHYERGEEFILYFREHQQYGGLCMIVFRDDPQAPLYELENGLKMGDGMDDVQTSFGDEVLLTDPETQATEGSKAQGPGFIVYFARDDQGWKQIEADYDFSQLEREEYYNYALIEFEPQRYGQGFVADRMASTMAR